MYELVLITDKYSIKRHSIKLFQNSGWHITTVGYPSTQEQAAFPRNAVILFYLERWSEEHQLTIERLSLQWLVCVLGNGIPFEAQEKVWQSKIIDYFPIELPRSILLKKINRLVQAKQSKIMQYSGVSFDQTQGVLKKANLRIHLSKLENELVSILFQNLEKYVSRNTILEKVWPIGVFASDDALDVLIRRVRYKIQPVGLLILVKRGFGYQLNIVESLT